MSAPKVGDLVNIEIRNVKVDRVDGCEVFFTTRAGGQRIEHSIHVGPGWPDVTVTSLAPAEWPPVAGDAWRDKHGELWFAFEGAVNGEPGLTMRAAKSMRWSAGHEGQIEDNGPWTLVHREPVDAPKGADKGGDR